MIAALLLLLSASDQFPADWQPGAWGPGLRGMPSALVASADGLHFQTIETGQDAYPWAEDMVRTLPRPITRAETPLISLWIVLPPFSQWPTGPNFVGVREYFGFRVIVQDQYLFHSNYYPGFGLMLAPDGTPWFGTKILDTYNLSAPIPHAGEWSLGLRFDQDGILHFLVHEGFVELMDTDEIARDTMDFPRQMYSLTQHFLALRQQVGNQGLSTDWILNRLTVRANIRPKMEIVDNAVKWTGTYPTEPYALQDSADLSTWNFVESVTGDGSRDAGTSPHFWRFK